MTKEFEALERLKTAPSFMGGTKEYMFSMQSERALLEDYELIKQALTELKTIREADPSKVLEELEKVIEEITISNADLKNTLKTSVLIASIKQALQRLNKYEQILSEGRLTNWNYKNTTLDLDSCKPYLRLGYLEDIYEGKQ